MTAPIAVIMGSQSDWDTMRHAADTLAALGVAADTRIVSAHRTPDRLFAFAKGAKVAGYKVIIAGAGGAAHPARHGGGADGTARVRRSRRIQDAQGH
ncbi:phosphoribosylaminoimidazole carboxylase PurE protein [Bradyrhizobium sp. LB7.2]